MRKILLILSAIFLLCLQSYALTLKQIYESDIVTDEHKKYNEIKKLPKEEKREFVNKIGLYPNDEILDEQILLLYIAPKNTYFAIPDLLDYVAYNNGENYAYLKERMKKDNFNVFFEKSLLNTIYYDENKDEIYKLYDSFNNKLISGNFNASNPKDKDLFMKIYKYIFCDGQSNRYIIEGRDVVDVTDEFDEDRKKLLELYISLDEFKNPKYKKYYNIYRLEYYMLVHYNKYTEEFLRRKFNDKNTNYENLCYFISKVDFDIPISKEIEKEFDQGLYSPDNNTLPSMYYLSQITGDNDNIVKYIYSKNISLTPKQRLAIINMRYYGSEQTAYKIIDSVIANQDIPSDQKPAVICTALKKGEREIFDKAIEDISKNWPKYLKEYFETLP